MGRQCCIRRQNMNIKDQYRILEFGDLGDERGNLVVMGYLNIFFTSYLVKNIPCSELII